MTPRELTTAELTTRSRSPGEPVQAGLAFGLGAYGLWGLIPLYFHALGQRATPSLDVAASCEVLAHRVLWSLALLLVVVTAMRKWALAGQVLHVGRARLLLASTAMIGINWAFNIYAMAGGQVMQASLGYYITPLTNVFLGFLVLGERPRKLQWSAVALAAIGVGWFVAQVEGVPWLALTLALSFGFYGLLRKVMAVDGVIGLSVEVTALTPWAIAHLVAVNVFSLNVFAWGNVWSGSRFDLSQLWTFTLLASTGLATAVPLLLFVAAAKRLNLSTVGMLQYLAPSLQFLMAVAVLGEPFSQAKLIGFVFIWVAVALYCLDAYRGSRQHAAAMIARARTQQPPGGDPARGMSPFEADTQPTTDGKPHR